MYAAERTGELVDDACLVQSEGNETFLVLGYARDDKPLAMFPVRNDKEVSKLRYYLGFAHPLTSIPSP